MEPVYITRTKLISANLEKYDKNEYTLHLYYRVQNQDGTFIYDIPKVRLPIDGFDEISQEDGNVYLKFFNGIKLPLDLNEEGAFFHIITETPSKRMTIISS